MTTLLVVLKIPMISIIFVYWSLKTSTIQFLSLKLYNNSKSSTILKGQYNFSWVILFFLIFKFYYIISVSYKFINICSVLFI